MAKISFKYSPSPLNNFFESISFENINFNAIEEIISLSWNKFK